MCSVPGIGDLGGLLGLCGAKSGALGDISNINGNCKNPPVPEAPGDAIAGWLEIHPARPPAQAAAFGPRAASTEYDQYGYAGLTWSNYDQPCLIPNVGADVETLLGNWALGAAKVIVATDNTVHAWAADPAWMSALIPIVTGSTGTLYRALFLGWAAVAMLVVAISVLFRANRSDTSGAVTLVAWAVLVVGLVAAAVASPGWAGQQAQSLMGSTLSALDSGFAGPGSQASANQAHDSLIVQSVLYPAWLRGELGDPGSDTAQKYGPQLFTAQALTWAQATGTPAQITAATKSDQTAWSAVAGKVQQADPVAYSVLTGNSMDRLGAGALAVVTALIVCTFDILASLVVVIALLGVLAGTVMLPAVGAAAMHHRMRHLVIGIGSWVLGMLINAVMWAAAAGVDEVATRALLTQNIMPLQMVLLLLAVLPIALWMIIRRLRGRDAIPRPVRRLLMLGVASQLLHRGVRSGASEALERAAQPLPAPSWSWRASPLPRSGAYPGGWNPRPGLTPVPPAQLPPPGGPRRRRRPPAAAAAARRPPAGPERQRRPQQPERQRQRPGARGPDLDLPAVPPRTAGAPRVHRRRGPDRSYRRVPAR